MSDLLLNQLKTPIEILFDKINFKNNTALDYRDFDLSPPEPVEIFGNDANTKIIIVPKLISPFYKTQTIYYKRLDFAEILTNPVGEILPGAFTKLSELLPQINLVFGLNLKIQDIYEQTLPDYSFNSIAGTVRVAVVAKPDSFLFQGNYNLLLGPVPQSVENFPFSLTYYVQTKGFPNSEYFKGLTSINADGTTNAAFSLFRNATGVSARIDDVILKNNGELVLNGDFTFSARLGNETVASVITSQAVVIREDGSVKETSPTPLFNKTSLIKLYEHPDVGFKYVIDPTSTSNANAICRYDQNGVQDGGYNPSAIDYKPTLLSVVSDGSLYTVSPIFVAPLASNGNIPSKQIRIDRLLPTGQLDVDFNPVIISGNGADNPLPVAQIVPFVGNGFWMALVPLFGVSVQSVSPVINGIPVVPGGVVEAYSWNPVFRLSNSGQLSPDYNQLLRDNLDKSIFLYAGSGFKIGDSVLSCDEVSSTFLSYKDNPITGFTHKQPITFNSEGKINLLGGDEYVEQYRWEVASNVITEPDGRFVSYGRLAPKLIDGGFGPVSLCIGRYNKNGSVDKLIYKQPASTTLNTALTLEKVLVHVK
jgi:hypothetical protein